MPRLLLPTLLCLTLSTQAEAKPVAATLYPAGTLVTEELEAQPNAGRITLTLPAGADMGTLSVALSRGGVQSRTVTSLPGEASPTVKVLQKKLDEIRGRIDLKRSELANNTAMRQFWSQPPYSLYAPSQEMLNGLLDKLSLESSRQMNAITEKETALRGEIRCLEQEASALDARIRALGKQNTEVKECLLTVDGTGEGPVTVRWSYWLDGAGWKPQYSVATDSSTGQVRISMQAELAQNSGMDWEGVELTLATSNQLYNVEPPPLRDWVIGQSNNDAAPRVMLAKSAVRSNTEAAIPAVNADEAGLTWSLGRMDIPASSTVTRLVGLHEFEATFSRLLRPRQSKDIWMYAALDAKALAAQNALLLPSGQATFLVDGRETAHGSFNFGPASREIFFGIDQLMKAEINEVSSGKGNTAPNFFSKDATHQWSWNSVIHNGHGKTVALRMEEAAPIAREADTKITVKTSPEATLEAGKSRYVWELSVPARGKAEIRYEVKAVIPEK